MSTEQHLFRRTQTRQILEAMRQADWPRYLTELADVMESGTIRFHIKNVVALWLGTLSDPTPDELRILDGLDDLSEEFPLVVRDALLGSSGWFDIPCCVRMDRSRARMCDGTTPRSGAPVARSIGGRATKRDRGAP
ncbi:hypothetical protein [Hyphomicrobium sp.]|uniref:hypothetical protein n=1 Tax=Hyphomicrobium sp. TaxID=82 RepID=UPI002FDDD1EF